MRSSSKASGGHRGRYLAIMIGVSALYVGAVLVYHLARISVAIV